MFLQLAKRSTRILGSGIFREPKTFVVVPNILSKFSKIGHVFFFSWSVWCQHQLKCMMSASVEIIFYWAWLIVYVRENEPKITILRVKYHVYFTTHKTAPLGATKSWKSIVNVLHMLDVVSSENREKTLRFVLTFHGQATDKLPTGYRYRYRQTTNCRPTVGRQLTDSRPTGFLGSSSSQLPTTSLYDITGRLKCIHVSTISQ